MTTLQSAFDKALREAPTTAFAGLIEKKLAAQNVTLSTRDRRRLVTCLESGELEEFKIRRWRWWEKCSVTIDLSEEDLDRIEADLTNFLVNDLESYISETADDLVDTILLTLEKNWPAERRRQDRQLKQFRNNLDSHWRRPLQLLRMFVTTARELAEAANVVEADSDYVLPERQELLMRLHARSCQVAEEVVCLLQAGFADGAMARWRTLHEIAVVSLLLSANDEELAQRYVSHDAVESYKAAREYTKHYETLGFEEISDIELTALENEYTQAISKFGRSFKSQYGWAAELLGNLRPTFADLEKEAAIDHLRTYYRMASHQVHSNPKGIFVKLGLMGEIDVLLAGPSNFGLADPGQSTALSLLQVTSALLLTAPNLDGIVGAKLLTRLAFDICDSFVEAQSSMES